MNVLGIHAFSHDAGAVIVGDGGVFGISQERLSRKKHDGRFPRAAIKYVMEQAGIEATRDVDLIVCDAHAHCFSRVKRALRKMGFRSKLHPVSHHDAHAASAYFTSPFEESALLVIDACGSFANELPGPLPNLAAHEYSRELQSFYAARHGRIEQLSKTFSSPDYCVGPGAMYGIGAMMAGFSDLGGGKLMALAALGKRDSLFPDCRFTDFEGTQLASGNPECDPLVDENLPAYSRLFFRGVKPRRPDEPIMQVHGEIARAVQKTTREAALAMARHLHAATGCENLCVAGGFALNCPTNSAYLRETPFKRVYVQPAATDAGIPLGAALHGYHVIAGQSFRPAEFSPFLGRTYSSGRIGDALGDYPELKYSRPRNLSARAAALIANGKICGFFKGGCEFGPRALGARSILADPRSVDVRKRLNATVKIREDFRPYAPAVLEERCAELFRFATTDPYMLFFANAKPAAKKVIPAVVHVDGTARLQSVSENGNNPLRKLIENFDSLTGVPALLNTSFNRRGEPIVETPEDALDCFIGTGMDFLVIEDYIVFKSRRDL